MSTIMQEYRNLVFSSKETVTPLGQENRYYARWNIEGEEFASRHLPFLRKYQEWYAGQTRVAYLDRESGVVYKVALNPDGEIANQNDLDRYQEWLSGDPQALPYAECEEESEGVIIMEMVEMLEDVPREFIRDHEPSDGYQVGRRDDGTLVYVDSAWWDDDEY